MRVIEEGKTLRYEFRDEKSEKFWEITLNGDSYTVAFGRIGKNPQTKTKPFENSEIALKEANKICKAKVKKGYILV